MSERPSVLELAKMNDHSLLHPTLTTADLRAGLEVAKAWSCATACIKPYAVPLAAEVLAGSGVAVCAVAGFPHGNSHPEITVAEAERAMAEGATEIDMVVNAGHVLGGDWAAATDQIRQVNQACVRRRALLKVIFENDFLRPEHIIRLSEICTELEVAFIKTSTGYGFVKQTDGSYNYRGATDEHLRLMRRHAGPRVQIKAAGGVRTLDDLLRVRALGVTRVGATATVAMLQEAVRRGFPGPMPPAARTASAPSSEPVSGY